MASALMDSHRYSALPHHRFHPQRFYGTDTMFYTDQPVVSDEFFGSTAELQQHRENPRYCGRSPASFSDESFAFVTAHQQHREKSHQFAYTQHKMVTISIPSITAFQQPPPSSSSFSKFQFWAQLCQIKEGKGGKIRRDHFWRNNKKKPYDRPPCTTDNGNGERISDICFLDLDLEISESLFTSHTMEENKLFAASFINGERVVSVSDKTDLTSYVSRVDEGITEDDDLVGGTIGSQEADECALTALKLFYDIPVRNVSVEQSDVHKQLGGWPLLQSEVNKQELSSLAHAGEGDESGDYGDMFRRTGIGVVYDAIRRNCDGFRRTGIGVVCDAIRVNGDKFSRTRIDDCSDASSRNVAYLDAHKVFSDILCSISETKAWRRVVIMESVQFLNEIRYNGVVSIAVEIPWDQKQRKNKISLVYIVSEMPLKKTLLVVHEVKIYEPPVITELDAYLVSLGVVENKAAGKTSMGLQAIIPTTQDIQLGINVAVTDLRRVTEVRGDDAVCVAMNSAKGAGSLFKMHISLLQLDLLPISDKNIPDRASYLAADLKAHMSL